MERSREVTESKGGSAEERRIREVYAERERMGKSHLYAWWRPEVLFAQYCLRTVAASFLLKSGLEN